MATATDTPRIRATAKYVRSSARKARLVADQIRGKTVMEAQAILAYSPRGAATPIRKVLQSAIANADHNNGYEPTDLMLSAITVDEGPTLRRFRPRAQGRATRINKRTCHISVAVSPVEGAQAAPAADDTGSAGTDPNRDEE